MIFLFYHNFNTLYIRSRESVNLNYIISLLISVYKSEFNNWNKSPHFTEASIKQNFSPNKRMYVKQYFNESFFPVFIWIERMLPLFPGLKFSISLKTWSTILLGTISESWVCRLRSIWITFHFKQNCLASPHCSAYYLKVNLPLYVCTDISSEKSQFLRLLW
jgi:hypothetical protein